MKHQPQIILCIMAIVLAIVMVVAAKAQETTVLDINTGQIKICTKSGNTTSCF